MNPKSATLALVLTGCAASATPPPTTRSPAAPGMSAGAPAVAQDLPCLEAGPAPGTSNSSTATPAAAAPGWATGTPSLVAQLTSRYDYAAISLDNRLLLTCAGDSVWLTHLASGLQLRRLEGRELGMCRQVAFLANGRAISRHDFGIQIWRLDTGEPLERIEDQLSFSVSRDGRLLALSGRRPSDSVGQGKWTHDSGATIELRSGLGPPRKLDRTADLVVLSPDGHWLLSAETKRKSVKGEDTELSELVLWRVAKGTVEGVLAEDQLGRACAAFSGDGTKLATCSSTGADLWSIPDGRHTGHIGNEPALSIALAPNAGTIAIETGKLGDHDGDTTLFSIDGQTLFPKLGWSPKPGFSPDGSIFFTTPYSVDIWDMKSGTQKRRIEGDTPYLDTLAFIDDRFLVVDRATDTLLWDLRRQAAPLAIQSQRGTNIAISPDASLAIVSGEMFDLHSGGLVHQFDPSVNGGWFDVSPDWSLLLRPQGATGDNAVLWDIASQKKKADLHGCVGDGFSPDGKRILCRQGDEFGLRDLTGAPLWNVTLDGLSSVEFLDNSRVAAVGSSAEVLDASNGKPLGALTAPEVNSTLSSNGKYRYKERNDCPGLFRAEIYDAANGRRLSPAGWTTMKVAFNGDSMFSRSTEDESVQIISLPDFTVKSRIPVSPQEMWPVFDGHYLLTWSTSMTGGAELWDTHEGRRVCSLFFFGGGAWAVVAPDGRFDTNQPDGLSSLHWVSAQHPFEPVPIETTLRDYFEPNLLTRILAGETFAPVRTNANVDRNLPSVEIEQAEMEQPAESEPKLVVRVAAQPASGGEIHDVRIFRDGRLVGQCPAPTTPIAGSVDEEMGRWRATTRLAVDASGRAHCTVRMAPREGGKSRQVAAYAFNRDRIKSQTVTQAVNDWTPGEKPRHAFVITIGVSKNQALEAQLTYAANDAAIMQEGVVAALARRGEYEVVRIPLVSPLDGTDAPAGNLMPTKDNIRATLERTAQQAGPDDLVLLSFSGHGQADASGHFYLFPYDLGSDLRSPNLLKHGISTDELAFWLRGLDAEALLIVDACQSAAAVDTPGFKPGPFGARGLGQLAYDKGIVVLAATGAERASIGSGALGASLLTWAFAREGLQENRAARGFRLTMTDAADYAVRRVPSLYTDVVTSRKDGVPQVPVLFDFRRVRDDADLGTSPSTVTK